jgi:UDP-2,3-diacylglucosamine pyrophosphatase LpxH
VEKQAIHETADKRRLLIIHGHELDSVVQNMKWLAYVGDFGYQLLLKLNRPINFVRRLFGRDYWSLSAYVKKSVKNAVSFIGQFEQAIVRYAKEYSVDGVVCGHIHSPVIRKIENVDYYNSGDWVESCSVLLEDHAGKISLLTNIHPPAGIAGAPPQIQDEEEKSAAIPAAASQPIRLAESDV